MAHDDRHERTVDFFFHHYSSSPDDEYFFHTQSSLLSAINNFRTKLIEKADIECSCDVNRGIVDGLFSCRKHAVKISE